MVVSRSLGSWSRYAHHWGLHIGEECEDVPVPERRVVNKAKAVGDISRSIAGEQRLLEAAISSRGLRRHNANQVANCGDDIRREGTQNMAVTQITVGRITGDYEFCFSIVEPAYRVLLPEGGKDETMRGGGRRVAGL
jgi:hypothetical protein